jgi:hypothetical protein
VPTSRRVLTVEDLRKELVRVRNPFDGLLDADLTVVVKNQVRRRPKNQEAKKDSEVEYLNSFFLSDLDALISAVSAGERLSTAAAAYLAPAVPTSERVDILRDHAAFERLVSPSRLPAGRWPSSPDKHLSIGQQAAVFEIVAKLGKNDGLVAVNGPPGTGKSTLLYDVIADVVVERAKRLANLESPNEIFEQAAPVPIAGFNTHPLRVDLVGGTGIVVASSNNAAVENITREMPMRDKRIPRGGLLHRGCGGGFRR